MPSAENAEGIFTWYYDTFEGDVVFCNSVLWAGKSENNYG